MRQQNCIFCGVVLDPSQLELDSSRTQEHVFARWIRDAVSNQRMQMFEIGVGGTSAHMRQLPLGTFVNANVCKACNNGWMEELESATDPIAEKLFNGTRIQELPREEIETLAHWTAKTAAVLSYATPQQKRVPLRACRSVHPDSSQRGFRFFYSAFSANINIEGAYLQLTYGDEISRIGSSEISGTRILICLNNHCFIADFPPVVEGTRYDLSQSLAAELWPVTIPAGLDSEDIPNAPINEIVYRVASSIAVGFDPNAFRA